jgi:hypothetical protein
LQKDEIRTYEHSIRTLITEIHSKFCIIKGEKLKVKVNLSLCLNKHHTMKANWESGGITPPILDLGTRWRQVVSFTPHPLYFQGKSPWYPLDRRLAGP